MSCSEAWGNRCNARDQWTWDNTSALCHGPRALIASPLLHLHGYISGGKCASLNCAVLCCAITITYWQRWFLSNNFLHSIKNVGLQCHCRQSFVIESRLLFLRSWTYSRKVTSISRTKARTLTKLVRRKLTLNIISLNFADVAVLHPYIHLYRVSRNSGLIDKLSYL